MPLYEYECDACGHKFEKIQKFSDPIESKCPKCGGPVHKLMSSPAIQFKGSGFYITDYAKKDHVDAAKADSGDAGRSAAADKGATEKSAADKSEKPSKSESTSSSTKSEKPASSSDTSGS